MDLMKNSVVVFKDRHSERMFHVPTPEALYKMALFILRERLDDGWYGGEEDYEKRPVVYEMSDIHVELIPKEFSECVLRQQAIFEQKAKHFDEDKIQFAAIEACLKVKNGKDAWEILLRRSHRSNEYESIYVVEMEAVDEPWA